MGIERFYATCSPAIYAIWIATLVASVLFFIAVYWRPMWMVRLQSMPWAFQLEHNLDIDFQSVLYATYHTHWFNRFTHWTIAVEQIAWFVVLMWVHPLLPILMMLLLGLQAAQTRDSALTLFAAIAWGAVYACATCAVNGFGMDRAVLHAETVLIGCAIWRFFGHICEPLPPFLCEESDRFLPIARLRFGPKVLVFAVLGYLSEFASALPFRLFVVQLNWMLNAVGHRSERVISWAEADRLARAIHQAGWRAYPKTAMLFSISASSPRPRLASTPAEQ